jgi:NAD(P)-dependent dehydrogenase (short-subunit alcohol dehydrogenase family)
VCDENSVKQLIVETVKCYGRLDAAFNNAGVTGKLGFGKLEYWSVEEFDKAMAVNARGVFLCMKYEILQFRRQQAARAEATSAGDARVYSIVNTASVAGLTSAHGQSGYAASKHAVVGLTRSVALEYAAKNIRCNAVCPSIIRTPMAGPGSLADDIALRTNPTQRLGTVFEVVNAIEFLLTASFVTGSCLTVDGGYMVR